LFSEEVEHAAVTAFDSQNRIVVRFESTSACGVSI